MESDQLSSVERMVREFGYDPKTERGRCALVAVAACFVGPNLVKISRLLSPNVTQDILSKVSWRLRTHGIWRGGKVVFDVDDLNDNMQVMVCLTLQCLVAEGCVTNDYAGKEKWLQHRLAQEAIDSE